MKDFDKAKKNGKRVNHKWYIAKIGGYECMFFMPPILPFYAAYDKVKNKHWTTLTWSEEKARKILDMTLPKLLKWDEEEKEFYYLIPHIFYDFRFWKKVPILHRAWAKKFTSEMLNYLLTGYRKDGYTKRVEVNEYDASEKWVYFSEI